MEKGQVTLESLAALVAKQGQQLSQVLEENAQLKGAQLKDKKEVKLPQIPKEPVTIEGKKYLFTAAHFTVPGEVPAKYTAEEAATDEDVLKQILAISGQGILKEVL